MSCLLWRTLFRLLGTLSVGALEALFGVFGFGGEGERGRGGGSRVVRLREGGRFRSGLARVNSLEPCFMWGISFLQ